MHNTPRLNGPREPIGMALQGRHRMAFRGHPLLRAERGDERHRGGVHEHANTRNASHSGPAHSGAALGNPSNTAGGKDAVDVLSGGRGDLSSHLGHPHTLWDNHTPLQLHRRLRQHSGLLGGAVDGHRVTNCTDERCDGPSETAAITKAWR